MTEFAKNGMNKNVKTKYQGVTYRLKVNKATGIEEKVFYIQYYGVDRKRHLETVGSAQKGMTAAKASQIRATRTMGKEKANKERRRISEEEKLKSQNCWTFNKLWEEYKRVRPELKSIDKDDNRYRVHLAEPFGKIEPKDLTPTDLDNFKLKLARTKASKGSIKNILELLRRIVNFGIKKHFYPPLPFIIEVPSVNNLKTEILNQEELKLLLDVLETHDNKQAANIMKLALFTGMRRGELFALKWSDLDFEKGLIHLTGPVKGEGPKGGKDQVIPMSESAKETLIMHEKPYPESPYVFPGQGGNMRKDIKKAVNEIKKKAGLPEDFRALHGLRHVFATMLASSGEVSPYALQHLLTHKSPQMTDRYIHFRDDALQQGAAVMDDILSKILINKTDD